VPFLLCICMGRSLICTDCICVYNYVINCRMITCYVCVTLDARVTELHALFSIEHSRAIDIDCLVTSLSSFLLVVTYTHTYTIVSTSVV
jgi:hypothetical protein